MLCTRDKKNVRVAAFRILVTAGKTYYLIAGRINHENTDEAQQAALKEYFEVNLLRL